MSHAMRRRDVLMSLAAVPGALALWPARAQETDPPRIRLGIIGVGGRGAWIGNLFANHGGYEIVALADYFQDRVDGAGARLAVPPERRFTGLSGYRRLLETKQVDAVAIISPPYFHPEQAAAAVAAGKHVYLAKPVAVDVPGCQTIAESGARATREDLAFLVDFQTRQDPFYREALARVHAGALGDICFGEATYHAGRLGAQGEGGSPEGRLRNWVFDKALSGDIITEQNIHTLDVMNWVMQKPPEAAWGTGGRKVRVDVGDCWDHFAITYRYPGQVGMTFSSRQFDGRGSQPEGIRNRVFGSQGVLETAYGGQVLLRADGDRFYRGGATTGIYTEGAVANIAQFFDDITARRFDNPTVAPSVQSNLITLLGRTAAYHHEPVTWEALLRSQERLDGRLQGLKV